MNPLTEDQKRAIRDLRGFGAAQTKTAEILGIDRSTVVEHEQDDLDRADPHFDPHDADYRDILSDDIDLTDVLEPEYWPDDIETPADETWTGAGPADSPLEEDETDQYRLAEDYSQLSPGEFIEEFFDDFEIGLKKQFVRLQARRANRRGELPDEDKLQSDIERMGSGVGNSNDAAYIAEEYWAEAKRYLEQADATVFRSGEGGDSGETQGGEYVSPNDMADQQGQWVQIPGQGMQYGRWEQNENGAMTFVPMQPPQQGQMGQQMGPQMGQQMGPQMGPQMGQQTQQDSRIDKVEEKIERLADAIREDKQSQDGLSGIQSHIEQMKAISETVDELKGDQGRSDSNSEVRKLQQQLNQIRQELSQNGQQQSFSDPRDKMLSDLLQRDSLDTDTAMKLADKMAGEEDPEVEKKRIEKDLELQRLERKKERTESLVSGLENALEKVGQGIGNAMVGEAPQGGNARQQGQPQPQGQPQQQQPQQGQQQPAQPQPQGQQGTAAAPKVEIWECPQCGESSEQDPRLPGVECEHCDYSLMQCPDCATPVEILPQSQRTKRACPECDASVDASQSENGNVACLSCDWAGDVDDLGDEVTECDGCGSVHKLTAAAEEGSR